MPRVSNELASSYWEPQSVGPVAQADLSALLTPPATLAAGATYTAGPISADGFKVISAAAVMDQAGTLSVSRFLDLAGSVPQGGPVLINLSAGSPGVANVTDGLPFQSFTVTLTNTSGTAAHVTATCLLLNAA